MRGRVYNDVKAAKALAAKSVLFKIKKPHAPHLHLPAALGGCHLTGKHSAGADGADGMNSAAGATKDLHGAAATLQARFRRRRRLPSNAVGASDVPKDKHGVAATLHASKLRVPRLHLRLPAALGGRRPASKRPVGASEGAGKAATRAALL